MNFKEFLKPTKGKIILFIILIFLIFIISTTLTTFIGGAIKSTNYMSYPLPSIKNVQVTCAPDFPCPLTAPGLFINYLFLIIDLIFWYLISCVLILTYKKVVKK